MEANSHAPDSCTVTTAASAAATTDPPAAPPALGDPQAELSAASQERLPVESFSQPPSKRPRADPAGTPDPTDPPAMPPPQHHSQSEDEDTLSRQQADLLSSIEAELTTKSFNAWFYSLFENDRANLRHMVQTFKLPQAIVAIPPSSIYSYFRSLIVDIIPRRPSVVAVPDLDAVVDIIRRARRICVLTGAGISVSSGIPDFRSSGGVYSLVGDRYPDLPTPEAIFDLNYFRTNPGPFFAFASEMFPGMTKYHPTPTHYFIRLLQDHGQLERNYAQNIDGLELEAGITKLVQCHGSFATATCQLCARKYQADDIREAVMAHIIPRCECDPENSVIKPDIIFFSESLPSTFDDAINQDSDHIDAMIVIGTSLQVSPVSLVPSLLPRGVPRILINRELVSTATFDAEILGDCDKVIVELCRRLGWLDKLKALCAADGTNLDKVMINSETDIDTIKPGLFRFVHRSAGEAEPTGPLPRVSRRAHYSSSSEDEDQGEEDNYSDDEGLGSDELAGLGAGSADEGSDDGDDDDAMNAYLAMRRQQLEAERAAAATVTASSLSQPVDDEEGDDEDDEEGEDYDAVLSSHKARAALDSVAAELADATSSQ